MGQEENDCVQEGRGSTGGGEGSGVSRRRESWKGEAIKELV